MLKTLGSVYLNRKQTTASGKGVCTYLGPKSYLWLRFCRRFADLRPRNGESMFLITDHGRFRGAVAQLGKDDPVCARELIFAPTGTTHLRRWRAAILRDGLRL